MKNDRRGFAAVVVALIILVLVIVIARETLVQAYSIPAGSMRSTLEIGDNILVSKLAYGIRLPFSGGFLTRFESPKRGDLVVFIFPKDRSKDFVKRVIGVGGEIVGIKDKQVYVNGQVLEEPYISHEEAQTEIGSYDIRRNFGPVQVPEGKLFVLGDNRDRSYDSRFWGFVDVDDVKGRVALIYWSWDRENHRVRWERVGKTIS